LLSSNISPTCPYSVVNFGPLAAEIVLLVWGTSANFNGFRVLVALLHGTLLVGVSQTAALNRGRNLYLAGRPSRWALAHISSFLWSALCGVFELWSGVRCDNSLRTWARPSSYRRRGTATTSEGHGRRWTGQWCAAAARRYPATFNETQPSTSSTS